jgi:dTDP-glucose pyrophosphorylase
MHDYVAEHKAQHISAQPPQSNLNHNELYLGHVIDSAIQNGIQTEAVIFLNCRYLDIGTPEDLKKAFKI